MKYYSEYYIMKEAKQKKVVVSITLEKEEKKKLQAKAKADRRNVSNFVSKLIAQL